MCPFDQKKGILKDSHIYFSYEIQEEGPVQQISYVSDTEQGYLRLVAEESIDKYRLVIDLRHGVKITI